ncbi:MAG TPA: divergent polysaccharide deacetylase family protein, partial [Vineibacter sp.]|nr:divergent polysaccharide deacetylase family protein [Vineibacter sp.]
APSAAPTPPSAAADTKLPPSAAPLSAPVAPPVAADTKPPPSATPPAPPEPATSGPPPSPPPAKAEQPPSSPPADATARPPGNAGAQTSDAAGAKPPTDAAGTADKPDDASARRPAVPAPTLVAANGLPAPPPEKPSVPARCPPLDPTTLSELTPVGRLPRVDAGGCMPWLAYAAPFNYRETRPRVGVVVLGLGKDPQVTQRAIDGLPPRVSLAFASDAPWLDRWVERARARGHEVLVMLPVQTADKPLDSTMAPLRADIAPAENLRRLQTVLARAGTGYIGVIVPTTTPLNAAEPALRPLLKEISDRGLLLLETFRTGRLVYQLSRELGLPYSADAGWIDRQNDPADIVANLQALEEFTTKNRFALAVSMAQRDTVERLIAWSKDVESRGLVLAPVTGLTECLDQCAERVRKAMGGGAR